MSIQWFKHIPDILVALGVLLALLMIVPVCFAGGAATIVPDKNQLAPRGSYIPDRRVKQILKKVNEYKAMMEKKNVPQRKEQPKEDKVPEP